MRNLFFAPPDFSFFGKFNKRMRVNFSENRLTIFLLTLAAIYFSAACRTAPVNDLRKLAPRETLVYLETKDVGATLDALTASPAFRTLAGKKDFSALANVQVAVAVTGFETSEKDSILNLKPRFVAVADTHLWNWQAVALVENQLDGFVRKNYGAAAQIEKIDKDDGAFFTWTAEDSRRFFAFAQDGLIYFGNDAGAIEKCLAIKKGAGESLAQNEYFARAYKKNNLAFGYVSSDGISQIAALEGVSIAVSQSEEANERSFIARILPPILQNTTSEIVWTANRGERGIEDKYSVTLKPEIVPILKEILDADAVLPKDFVDFLPSEVFSATRYNLRNPLLAWRGSVLLATRNTDDLSRQFLSSLSGKLLEPYSIGEAELFLSAVSAPIVTAQFDATGEKSVTLATVKDLTRLKDSISKEINFESPPEKQANSEIWFSQDKTLAAAFIENKIILGDGASVLKCLAIWRGEKKSSNNITFLRLAANQNVAATFGTDADSAEKIAGVLGNLKTENRKPATFYTTETRLTENGFERVTVSDFGFVGTILKNLN